MSLTLKQWNNLDFEIFTFNGEQSKRPLPKKEIKDGILVSKKQFDLLISLIFMICNDENSQFMKGWLHAFSNQDYLED